jgi:hypothetical protein
MESVNLDNCAEIQKSFTLVQIRKKDAYSLKGQTTRHVQTIIIWQRSNEITASDFKVDILACSTLEANSALILKFEYEIQKDN